MKQRASTLNFPQKEISSSTRFFFRGKLAVSFREGHGLQGVEELSKNPWPIDAIDGGR